MGSLFYYLMTFAEALLGIFGIRSVYEQPPYAVVERLSGGVEVRDYGPRDAVETDGSDDSAAFGRLFRYITGANAASAKVAMTVPVSQSGDRGGARIAMTAPVQTEPGGVMRFFLPKDVARAGAPAPTDPLVRLVTVPAQRLAVLRFSGAIDRSDVAERQRALLDAVVRAGRTPQGAAFLLTYDAPFTLPFLRRNEVAAQIASP